MKKNQNNILLKSRFILIGPMMVCSLAVAQNVSTEPVAGKTPVSAARSLMSQNKNGEALIILKNHGQSLKREFDADRDSLIESMEGIYKKQRSVRRSSIREKESEVATLREGNAGIREENMAMTTKTIAFFSILIGAIAFVLLSRYKTYRDVTSQLKQSENLLKSMEHSIENISKLKQTSKEQAAVVAGMVTAIDESEQGLSSISGDRQHKFQKQIQKLTGNIQIAHSILTAETPEPGLLVKTDLNALISEAVEETYHSMSSVYGSFNCTVVKDLEKILPKVEVIPGDIKFVLYCLLKNAFESVHDKIAASPKGYEPKVTISTRKLPRFVQIRIKDNGVGIPDKLKDRIFEPYFTTRNNDRNPGLGLSESHEIITKGHKGELFIESDFSNSTDFIIRFPILTLM